MKYSGVLPVGKEHTPQIFDHENMSQNWLTHHKVGPYQLWMGLYMPAINDLINWGYNTLYL